MNELIIKDGVLIDDNVSIFDNYHGKLKFEESIIPPSYRKLYSKGSWILEKMYGKLKMFITKLSGLISLWIIYVYDYALIGTNSVVTYHIVAYVIMDGSPIKVIRMIK